MTLGSPSNATLGGQTTHTFTITDDEVAVVSAETMDCNNNGRIDHYKVTYSTSVTDSTFPGYSINALGTSTGQWIVSGYSDIALRHGSAVNTACGVTDTIDDEVHYISFTEKGAYDTGSKPDLTTSATPGVLSTTNKTVAQVTSGNLTEIDRAKPVIVLATGAAAATNLTVTFSENVWGAQNMPACGSGGSLTYQAINYNNTNAGGATARTTTMGADSCASSDGNAIFVVDAGFSSSDGDGAGDEDSVAASNTTYIYDAANLVGNTTAKNITVSAGAPTVSSIEQYDTNGNGKIDQLKIIFSINMTDSTIDNADASRFTVGGTPASLLDSATSGTGTIAAPNNDPGTIDDNIVTIFTDDTTVSGTDKKAVAFTQNAGRWQGSGLSLLTQADFSAVTLDKAPPVILTAVASDKVVSQVGVDGDDTLIITFSEPTNQPVINTGNISSILQLSSGHVWGNITSAVWDSSTQLTITFADTTSTAAVGDTITILGTIADSAGNISVNKPSVSTIAGTFFTDTIAPYLVSAFNITTTTATIRFSEPVLMDGTANAANTIANYSFAEDPSNACSDVTISSITVVSTDTVQLNLSGPLCDIQYKVIVSNVRDYSNNTIGTPNFLTFIGNEQLKVVSIIPVTTTSFRINFNRPLKAGNNISGSGGCTTTTECAKRYYVAPAELGTVSSATVGTGALANTVTVVHTVAQAGKSYTVLVANNQDSDGFNNTTFGSVRDVSDTMNVQAAPADRATFVGLGTTLDEIVDGPFFTDPFFDGTSFSFVFKYGGRVYLGTNDKNTAAFRFDPNGNNAVTATFKFASGTCTTTTGFGYGTSPSCPTTSGPNGERGVVGFTSGTAVIGGNSYEILFSGPLKNNLGYGYYTQNLDVLLDWSQNTLASYQAGSNIASLQSIYVADDHLYECMASSHGQFAPVCGHYTLTASSGIVTPGTGTDMAAEAFEYLGVKASTNANPAAKSGGNNPVVGIDSIVKYKTYLYMGNNGGLMYSNNFSTFGSAVLSSPTFSGTTLVLPNDPAGLEKVGFGQRGIPILKEHNNNLYMVRNVAQGTGYTTQSTALRGEVWKCSNPGDSKCDPADWVQIITGTETEFGGNSFTISMFQPNGTGTVYIGIDNATDGVQVYRISSSDILASSNGTAPPSRTGDLSNGSTTITDLSTSSSDLVVGMGISGTNIPAGTKIKSITNSTTIVISNAATGNGNNTSLTFTNRLLSNAGWVKQGTNGLGTSSPLFTKIYASTTISDGLYNYLYFTSGTGVGGAAIKVFRQLDAVTAGNQPSAFLTPDTPSELLAYINQTNGKYPLALGILVFGILAFFGTRKFLKQPSELT